jgi:hypothetical protein
MLTRPLIELRDMQVALLRRDSTILLAVATNADALRNPEDARPERANATAVLAISSAPDSISLIDRGAPRSDGLMVLVGLIPARPALVAVEVLVDSAAAADIPNRRLRFGITTPTALRAIVGDTLIVSEPVLLEAPDVKGAVSTEPSTALEEMLPSTTLVGARRIGVYWEAYGLADTDSLDLSVRVVRKRVGFLQVLGGMLRLQGSTSTLVAIKWRDSGRPAQRTIDGARPGAVRPFSVALDLSSLESGHYDLIVSVTRRGRGGAESAREFEVR